MDRRTDGQTGRWMIPSALSLCLVNTAEKCNLHSYTIYTWIPIESISIKVTWSYQAIPVGLYLLSFFSQDFLSSYYQPLSSHHVIDGLQCHTGPFGVVETESMLRLMSQRRLWIGQRGW